MSDETQYTLAPEDEALLLDLIHREDVLAAADEREGPPPSDRRERSRRLRGMLDRLRGGAA